MPNKIYICYVEEMDGKYLDITKSVIVSSPAGSGKTEKLSRRYISLLLNGADIEKILCITFTEKAASEMKERILNILEKEYPDLFLQVKEKMPLMRISTIHSFCLKLLKRFSIELGLDPSLDVMDEFEAALLWSEAVCERLMEEKENAGLFSEVIMERGIKGWDKVYNILTGLYEKRPLSELLLKADAGTSGIEEKKILELFSKCLDRYKSKKTERHLFDFNDLELLSYDALMSHPEWQNILYSFDEHTDHMLVDEFQDTSLLQWKIIDKLTEEWRSGIGAKKSSGKTPTIFLVGDDKQSIYLFRGANVGVFKEAKNRFSEWLGKEYYFEEARENFRSLPAIINFTNDLFERLMPPSLHETWRTKYATFEATRKGDGRVELILFDSMENTKKNRSAEASLLAKRIKSLSGRYEIFDGEKKRPCAYGDMAVLLRRRTHLCLFESAFRKEHIPFIVAKGIGFYDEPEVAALRELLSFIIDPLDDYSLFCVLRSPYFGLGYETLAELAKGKDKSLFERFKEQAGLSWICDKLSAWIERSKLIPLAILLEDILMETGAWSYYWEEQRRANVKKFIKIIESYESAGFSSLEIREKLIKAKNSDESKANVNTEGMDVIRIMTVHAAKGLQFPMVFLPSLDENHMPRSSSIVIDEEDGAVSIAYEDDSAKRKKMPLFMRRKEKESEEEKRLFYVAVTRARDFLCMLGAINKDKQPSGRLSYITESFEILKNGEINRTDIIEILNEAEVNKLYAGSIHHELFSIASKTLFQAPVYIEPVTYEPGIKWKDVTGETDIRVKHGEEWVLLGRVFHKLFEEISKGILMPELIEKRTAQILNNEGFFKEDARKLSDIILNDIEGLKDDGFFEKIILPSSNSFAEMPFILQKGRTVFKGRVDRIIVEKNIAMIYDYKTFPMKNNELPELTEKYKFQMDIYKEAVKKILSLETKSFLLFTHGPLIKEI